MRVFEPGARSGQGTPLFVAEFPAYLFRRRSRPSGPRGSPVCFIAEQAWTMGNGRKAGKSREYPQSPRLILQRQSPRKPAPEL